MGFQVQSLASLGGLGSHRCHELWCKSQTWLRSHVAVAVAQTNGYSSNSNPSQGTSMCREYGPYNKQAKKPSVMADLLLWLHGSWPEKCL